MTLLAKTKDFSYHDFVVFGFVLQMETETWSLSRITIFYVAFFFCERIADRAGKYKPHEPAAHDLST